MCFAQGHLNRSDKGEVVVIFADAKHALCCTAVFAGSCHNRLRNINDFLSHAQNNTCFCVKHCDIISYNYSVYLMESVCSKSLPLSGAQICGPFGFFAARDCKFMILLV